MLSLLGQIVGGVGLFLIGTDALRRGFEESAGHSLRRILSEFTGKPAKGLFAGFIVSSAVQSATAVIFTLIGFVNAQMIQLRQAVSVVFGANLGKIFIVILLSALGFKLNVADYALPIIGAGAMLKIFLKNKRSGMATALMGFGLIFLGIETLKTSIVLVNHEVDLRHLNLPGQTGILAYLAVGMVMTFVTQSSTGAIVITLSALGSGVLPLENAIALVIGENFGTISSSLMASLGTTPAAKRLTAAHVIYNAVCTTIGLVLLEILVLGNLTESVITLIGGNLPDAFTLFYCAYIGLALLVLLPFSDELVHWLERHFHDTKSLGSPRFIQHGKIHPPRDALKALHCEVSRFGQISSDMLDTALKWNLKRGWVYTVDLSYEERELDRLSEHIQVFASQTARKHGSIEIIQAVQALLLASRHFETVSDLSKKISRLKSKITEPLADVPAFTAVCEWTQDMRNLLACLAEPLITGDVAEIKTLDAEFVAMEERKPALRRALLDAGVSKELSSSQTIILNDFVDACRRAMRDQLRGIYETWGAHDLAKAIPEAVVPGMIYSVK